MSAPPPLFLIEYLTLNPPVLFSCRELYALCQMFPEAACKAMQSIIREVAHSMEEVLEVKGHAAFPPLDMV